jgi:hypothetical protein
VTALLLGWLFNRVGLPQMPQFQWRSSLFVASLLGYSRLVVTSRFKIPLLFVLCLDSATALQTFAQIQTLNPPGGLGELTAQAKQSTEGPDVSIPNSSTSNKDPHTGKVDIKDSVGQCPESGILSTDVDAKRFLSGSQSDQDSEIAQLRSHEPNCLKVPEYYAHLGQYLLLSKKSREAVEALERSLLLKSDQPGVQLDFALALGLGGDIDSANALLTQVLSRDDVPEGLRRTLEGFLAKGFVGVNAGNGSEPTINNGFSQGVWPLFSRNAGKPLGASNSLNVQSQNLAQGQVLSSDPKTSALIDSRLEDASRQKSAGFGLSVKPETEFGSGLQNGLGTGLVAKSGSEMSSLGSLGKDNKAGIGIKSDSDGWHWSGSMQTMLGRDTNLNSASYTSIINLTLPNGIVPLALDASSLPQAGPTQVFAAQAMAQRTLGDRVLSMGGTLMQRQTPNLPSLSLQNQELTLQLRPKAELGWSQRAVLTHFELGGANFFNGLSFTMWKEWLAPTLEGSFRAWTIPKVLQNQKENKVDGLSGGLNTSLGFDTSNQASSRHSHEGSRNGLVCHYLTGLEVDRRTYSQDSSQDGAYRGVLIGALCRTESSQLNVVAQTGTDWASDINRAGGNQQRQELKVQWAHTWGLGRLGLEWGEQRLLDNQIYSELLGGVVRNTTRENIRLSWDYKVTEKLVMIEGSLHWVSFWEALQYRSSVELFNLKGQSIQTGLKLDF